MQSVLSLDVEDVDLSRRASLSDLVYARLREEIMSGLWRPGDRLTIRGQAARFRTSPTPVRDAMLQLAGEQALTLAPRSFRVPTMAKGRFMEIRKMRVALETMAAEEAAAVAPFSVADDLDAIHEELARVKAGGDARNTMILNRHFHFTLYAGAGMPQCLDAIKALWARAAPYQHYLYVRPCPQTPETHEHLRIIEALRRRDGALAREAVRLDITVRSTPINDDLFAGN